MKMNLAAPIVMVMLIVSLSSTVLPSSDADTTVSGEYWCYGDMLHLEYGVVGTTAVVQWIVDPDVGETQDFTGQSIDFDATLCDEILVTQTVIASGQSVSQTILIHMVHMPEGSAALRVMFLKDKGGSEILGLVEFDEYTAIITGSDGRARFITSMPEVPEKDGYVFQGWFYTDSSGEHRFNEFVPVTTNMDVYAKWAPEGGSGSSVVIVDRVNVVTFQVSDGMRYHVSSVGKDSIRFSVSVMEGFIIDESTLSVVADAGVLSGSLKDGYILEGIDSSILVVIQADVQPAPGPAPSDPDTEYVIPLWVWILIIVLLVVMVILVLRIIRK